MHGTYIFVLGQWKICIQLEICLRTELSLYSIVLGLIYSLQLAKTTVRLSHTLYTFLGRHQTPHRSVSLSTFSMMRRLREGNPEYFSLSLSVYDIAVVVSTSSATVFIVDDESDGGMWWTWSIDCLVQVELSTLHMPSLCEESNLLKLAGYMARPW